jgi:ABC-type multidrug transport system fused ATPase/permease subunit
VSSLKKDHSQPHLPGSHDEGLGLENASFKWNEVTENPEEKAVDSPPSPTSSNDETGTVVDDSVSVRSGSDLGDRKFELRDLTIKFPEGELTVVTGPTASGKTALLVRFLFAFF